MSSLPLGSDDGTVPARGPGRSLVALLAVLVLLLSAGAGYVGYRLMRQIEALEGQLAVLGGRVDEAAALARQAIDRAIAAEAASRTAAEAREEAEARTADVQQQAETARQEATAARETAAQVQAEAERIRARAQAEVNRLEAALGQIAETRRTALGLTMSLGGDYLKFEFDKAELRPEDKELLSRIAGILMTSQDYTVSVNGHTDDVGSSEYNKKLSGRRAQAVRDYLVKAGLPADILSVEGHGKALPLVRSSSEAARAKNRRVELGIVNTQIRYGR